MLKAKETLWHNERKNEREEEKNNFNFVLDLV